MDLGCNEQQDLQNKLIVQFGSVALYFEAELRFLGELQLLCILCRKYTKTQFT